MCVQVQGTKISVQPGDVVGLYMVHEEGGVKGILDDAYTDELVWYNLDPTPSGDPRCPYPVGESATKV